MYGKARARTCAILLALALAGCREEPPARHEAAPPPAVAEGPVNPDPRVTRYTCVDGQAIMAVIDTAQKSTAATLAAKIFDDTRAGRLLRFCQ